MNPALTLSASTAATHDPVNKIGFFLLSLYFFFNYSRILDITAPSLHIPLFIGLALYAMAALAGSVQRALATTPGKLLIALTVLMLFAAVFGAWRGGGIRLLTQQWFKAFPFYFVVIGLCLTTNQVFRFMRTICVALTLMSLVALWRGENVLGRLIIDNSRFADPNDLALVCLIGIPFCCFLVARRENKLQRVAGLLMILPLLYATARTGSRGAALGMAGGLLYVFLKASPFLKITMAVGLVMVGATAAVVLPPEVYLRYVGATADAPNSPGELAAAESSATARLFLLKESIAITLVNPVFGVGAGNFPVVENDRAKASGLTRGSWHVTHNMYTQVSSENGIPAALLFIAVLGLGVRATKRTLNVAKFHPDAESVSKAAFWLRVALLVFSISGFFLSVAYTDMLPLLSGLAVAFELAVLNEIRMSMKAATPQPVASAPNPLPARKPKSIAIPPAAQAGARR